VDIKKALRFIVFTSIALGLLYLSFKNIDLEKLWHEVLKANFSWILLSLFLAFIGYISRAIRWKILIEGAGFNASTKNTILATFIAYFANIAFPRIGEVTRCGVLNRQEKIPMDKLLGTVVIERVCDLFLLMLVLGITIISKLNFFGSFFYSKVYLPLTISIKPIFSSPLALLIILIFAGICIFLYFRFKQNLRKNKLFDKTITFIDGIKKGLLSILHLKKKKQFIMHTIIIWLMYWGMTYVLLFAMKQTSHLGGIDGLFLLVAGGLAMAAPVQNGYGAFHWIVSQALMLYGIDEATGLTWATINHESQTILVIILGTVATSYLSIVKKKKTAKTCQKQNQEQLISQ